MADYAVADVGLAACSVLFVQSPPLLADQRPLEQGQGRSNRQTRETDRAVGSAARRTGEDLRHLQSAPEGLTPQRSPHQQTVPVGLFRSSRERRRVR